MISSPLPAGSEPELRRDPVVGRWVILASERARRPSDFEPPGAWTSGPAGCPFCPGHEVETPPEILAIRRAGSQAWTVRVVPNRFPALRPGGRLPPASEDLERRMDGTGVHEVIIESPDHDADLGRMSPREVAAVLEAYRARLLALARDPGLAYALIFKNHGEGAGASLRHPHSQLIATPILPESIATELAGAARHLAETGRCVWCDLMAAERRDRARTVLEAEGFVAVAPFAPRFAFETWVLPIEHGAAFEQLDAPELLALAGVLRDLFNRFLRLLGDPPYNYALHTAPLREADPSRFHWHLEVLPRVTRPAGFEWGTGFFINPMPPEEAARLLRDAGGTAGVLRSAPRPRVGEGV